MTSNDMDILVIFARTEFDGCICVNDAYDTASRDDCPEVWEDKMKTAVKTFGADNVKVLRVTVPMVSVESMFKKEHSQVAMAVEEEKNDVRSS